MTRTVAAVAIHDRASPKGRASLTFRYPTLFYALTLANCPVVRPLTSYFIQFGMLFIQFGMLSLLFSKGGFPFTFSSCIMEQRKKSIQTIRFIPTGLYEHQVFVIELRPAGLNA